MIKIRLRKPAQLGLLLLLVIGLANCDTTSSSDEEVDISLRMEVALPVNKAISALSGDTLRFTADNGSVEITDIRFFSKEFSLERDDSACDDEVEDNNEEECEELEFPASFVDLPLDGTAFDLLTSAIPAGLYSEIEFEIDNLDVDEDDDEEDRTEQAALLQEARNAFSDWPEEATMVIVGTYTDPNNTETPFLVYAEAEVEIELEFEPPVQIDENTQVNNLIDIQINPEAWFLTSAGSLYPIWEYDYATTSELLEFEVEIENGFQSVEVDDEDDEEEDDD